MRILAVADTEEKVLWDYLDKQRFADVDLIISCGDLKREYLEFLVTMLSAPVLYVHGNHDDRFVRTPPGGCTCIDDKVYDYKGLRIMGLGGSMRYREGIFMYDEEEMEKRIQKLKRRADLMNGFDLLVTHAPLRGYGDMEDLPHRGFAAFEKVLDRYHPKYMLHGHVHKEYGHFEREREHPGGTKIINACGYHVFDISPEEYPTQGKTGSFLYDMVMSLRARGATV